MKETASYIILATSSGEPAMNNSVDYWTKYKDKRVVLSGSATSLTYSAQGNYYPYNPFATSELNLEYSAKVSNQKLKSVSLPSGSFTEIVNQDPKHSYNPSSFTLNGSSMDIKHGYDGSRPILTRLLRMRAVQLLPAARIRSRAVRQTTALIIWFITQIAEKF